jgi:hypothetical protein
MTATPADSPNPYFATIATTSPSRTTPVIQAKTW